MAGQVKLVGLLGVGGSGKAFVTRRLVEVYGFTHLRFGDAIRDMLAAGFGVAEDEFDNFAKKQPVGRFGGHTLANMMQTLTHDWGRGQIHSDLWTREYERRLGALEGFVVTDDLQRENEVAAVRDGGGLVVRITRPGYTPSNRGVLLRQARLVHDLELVNEGLDGLCQSVDRFVEGLNETLALATG